MRFALTQVNTFSVSFLYMLTSIIMLQHKCDLVNMSYGEPALLPDYGRFVDLVTEVSFKPFCLYLGSTYCVLCFSSCVN